MFIAGCANRAPVVSAIDPATDAHGYDAGTRHHPDGVALDPQVAIPSPVDKAEASGVVTLREPMPLRDVLAVIIALNDAWKQKSIDGLRALLTSDAVDLDTPKGDRASLVDHWRARLRSMPAEAFAAGLLFSLDGLVRYSYDELSAPGAPKRPSVMRPGDVYVLVPFDVVHAGSDRAFGEVLSLVLRREFGRTRVAAYGETRDP
jgi:hypothetical protein